MYKRQITARVAAHHEALGQAGIRINSPLLRYTGLALAGRQLVKTVRVLFGLPALIGTLVHLIPFVLVRVTAPRFQLPGRATVSFYRLIFGLPFYGCWYVAVWFLLNHFSGYKVATMTVAALPVLGVFSFHYWLNASEVIRSLREELKLIFDAKRLAKLREENQAIKNEIAVLGEDFRAAFPDRFTD